LSLNRNEKAAVVADVSTQVARSQTLALAEYRGLTVAHLDALRRQARDKGVYLHVLKNTLARRAVAGTPFECASAAMAGPLIYGFSEDAVAAAIPSREVLISQVAGLLKSPIQRLAGVLAALAEKKGEGQAAEPAAA
jgi:large subunit ribosomal protein L10